MVRVVRILEYEKNVWDVALNFQRIQRVWILAVIAALLPHCTHSIPDGPPARRINIHNIHNAKPRPLPHSKYGNPKSYTIRGKHYHVLKTAKGYNQSGMASWYGTKFHGELTSSREPYNMLAMTAASPVLPIPSSAESHQAFNQKPIMSRMLIVLAGPFVNVLLAVIVYWWVYLMGVMHITPVVGQIAPHSIAAKAGFQVGDQLLGIDHKPIQTWSQIAMSFAEHL